MAVNTHEQKSTMETEGFVEGNEPFKLYSQPKRATARQKAALLLLSIGVALSLSEVVARVTFSRGHDPFAHNPVIKAQSDDVDLFEPDSQLGHRLKGGKFIGVYARGLISFSQIVEDPRRDGRLVVLNIGDSSTSGWDSNVIAENSELVKEGRQLKSPFQAYKTYSDVLAENSRLYVINAGVPGYSSIQGYRYLKILLDEFKRASVRIDVVTVYFGNNDSIYNGNIEDKYQLPGREYQLQLFRVLDQATTPFRVVPRVEASEYGNYIIDMVKLSREAGTHLFLLEPVIPRMWQPGLRARDRDDEVETMLAGMKGTKVARLLTHAQELFRQGSRALSFGEVDRARQLLEQAREEDYVVPRIKQDHASVLSEVATRERVPLMSVKDRIPVNDTTFFRDYCHPDEPANRLFAGGLMSAMRDLQPRRP